MTNKISEITVSYSTEHQKRRLILNSTQSFETFLSGWSKDHIELQEEFKVLMLNRSNAVLGIYTLSKGGTTGTIVDPKLVFSVALKCVASAIIVAHNHPSGNIQPSEADKRLTKKLKKAGDFLDISVLDHIILTKDRYFSFSDEGLM